MPVDFPNPQTPFPVTLAGGHSHPGTVFLKAVLDHPRIEAGDYTYASSFDPPEDWSVRLAPYLFEFSPERLVIGKFCQIADGVTFITASANHRHDGVTSFPFAIFKADKSGDQPSMPGPGPDTVVGHDVWIGRGATILPGAEIGDGAIVGAGAVVAGRVGPYCMVAGNPARTVRQRFSRETVALLRALAWWDWPIEKIIAHEKALATGDLAALVG